MSGPTLSIVMPVYNTGALLLDAVRSVVAQTLFADEGEASWELLIVDDASSDVATRQALADACALSPSIRVLQNRRTKGAAGARNSGVFAARGAWIGFLDSDDLWYPDFLRRQRDAFAALPEARWRAAHFDVGDEHALVVDRPLRERSPCLYREIEADYVAGRVSSLRRPVDVLLRCGCMQVMTVQIRSDLIRAFGGFNESFACAEDYDLWIRLAQAEDLHFAPLDAGIYRLRSGSLTKSGRPMYHCEDRMLLGLRSDPAFAPFRAAIDTRLAKVYSTFCYHFRATGDFGVAAGHAARLIRASPTNPTGWRHLLASALRR